MLSSSLSLLSSSLLVPSPGELGAPLPLLPGLRGEPGHGHWGGLLSASLPLDAPPAPGDPGCMDDEDPGQPGLLLPLPQGPPGRPPQRGPHDPAGTGRCMGMGGVLKGWVPPGSRGSPPPIMPGCWGGCTPPPIGPIPPPGGPVPGWPSAGPGGGPPGPGQFGPGPAAAPGGPPWAMGPGGVVAVLPGWLQTMVAQPLPGRNVRVAPA